MPEVKKPREIWPRATVAPRPTTGTAAVTIYLGGLIYPLDVECNAAGINRSDAVRQAVEQWLAQRAMVGQP